MPRPIDCLSGLLTFAVIATATSSGIAAQKTAQADKPAEFATRGQREAKDITYGDWQKLCFKAGGAPTLCRTSITGKFPTGQTAVRVDLIEREDAPIARLQLFVPVGMSAFDIAGYKSQSLGALMFEQVARDCIERGDQMLDFTIGDEPYKKLFGGQPSPMWTVTQAGSTAGAISLFALKQAPWLKLAAKRMSEFRLLPTRTSTPTR